MHDIPDWLREALKEPTTSVPIAGKAVGNLSRNASYEAAARGEIKTIKFGRKVRVPSQWIRSTLGLESEVINRARAE